MWCAYQYSTVITNLIKKIQLENLVWLLHIRIRLRNKMQCAKVIERIRQDLSNQELTSYQFVHLL